MVTLSEIHEQAMQLPASQRATLTEQLLDSLPAPFEQEDDGVAEALRRDAELDADPSAGMTLEEFRQSFGR